MTEDGDFRIHRGAHDSKPSTAALVVMLLIICCTLVALCGISAWFLK